MLGKLKTLSLEALKMLQQDKREQLNSRNPAVRAAAKETLDALAAELVIAESRSMPIVRMPDGETLCP